MKSLELWIGRIIPFGGLVAQTASRGGRASAGFARTAAACIGLLVLVLAGCKSTPEPHPAPIQAVRPSLPPPDATTIDQFYPGDGIVIRFTGFPGQSAPVVLERHIREGGTLTVLSNDVFLAEGKTSSQLEHEIHDFYVPRNFESLTVTVGHCGCTRFYSVGGAVQSPGRQVFLDPMRVLDAIKQAGGFTKSANPKKVRLTRLDGSTFITNCEDPGASRGTNYEIFPGDKVFVPRSFWWWLK